MFLLTITALDLLLAGIAQLSSTDGFGGGVVLSCPIQAWSERCRAWHGLRRASGARWPWPGCSALLAAVKDGGLTWAVFGTDTGAILEWAAGERAQ